MQHIFTTLLFLVIASCCYAAPWYWVSGYAQSCDAHPTRAAGRHAPPVLDGDARITLNGTSSLNYCPGKNHLVMVVFPEERMHLMTATAGVFNGSFNATCPNRQMKTDIGRPPPLDNVTTITVANLFVPCSFTLNLTIKITSASNSADELHQTTTTLTPNPSCIQLCPPVNNTLLHPSGPNLQAINGYPNSLRPPTEGSASRSIGSMASVSRILSNTTQNATAFNTSHNVMESNSLTVNNTAGTPLAQFPHQGPSRDNSAGGLVGHAWRVLLLAALSVVWCS